MNIIKTNFIYDEKLLPLDLNKVKYIIIHHPEAITATPEQIHQWHLANGWAGFGYNEYIKKDGTVYIGRGDFIGAQCQNMNSISYGICCEGSYDKESTMPEAQKLALIERIKYNKARLPNKIEVAPHSKFCATSCPGKFFPLSEIMNKVNGGDRMEEHWAEQYWNSLNEKGIKITEKRFDDKISRGETFALLDRIYNVLANKLK